MGRMDSAVSSARSTRVSVYQDQGQGFLHATRARVTPDEDDSVSGWG
jgi:hypothetical protein